MDEDYIDLDDGLWLMSFVAIALVVMLGIFGAGFMAGRAAVQSATAPVPVHLQPYPLTYDEQHLLAYDFMVDNPHVRQELCSHRFIVRPMDSDRRQP